MTIPFANIPSNIRVPLFYAELNNTQANSSGGALQRTLIIGQQVAAGTAALNVPTISAGVGDAQTKHGINSVLANMVASYNKNDSFGEVWTLPVPEGTGAATDTVTFGGAPTASGNINIYIGGGGIWGDGTGGYSIPVTTASTPTTIASALAAAITADKLAPFSATSALGVVTLTADNLGLVGNDLDVRLNYLGTVGGQSIPAGLTVTIATPQFTGGTANPALTTALANCGSQPFDFIVCPYNDATTLNALDSFLNDSTGRWAWSQQIYGGYFVAARNTFGGLTTLGASRNGQHGTILGFYDSPTPNWIIAAQYAGASAVSLRNDPGMPLQYLPIVGMLAPPVISQFPLTENNQLLFSGIATYFVGTGGVCFIQNLITTYQTNASGQPDNSYLEVETMFSLAYVLRRLQLRISSNFGRMKLAANGTKFAAGSAVVTPALIQSALVAEYGNMEHDGYVQNSTAFAAGIIVQINATNPNRVDVLWPGTLIEQLRIVALMAQFRLK